MRDVASFLRTMRLQAGLTQYAAAKDILDKDNLSLIERGKQFPHAEHFILLLERYGVSGFSLCDFFDQRTADLLHLKNQILSAMQFTELGRLPELLFVYRTEFERVSTKKQKKDVFSRQFFCYAQAWLYYTEGGCADDFLDACVDSIRMTQPGFDESFNVKFAHLIQNELMIINSIACLCARFYMKRQALVLFEQLLQYQNQCIAAHPVHFRNLACLTHNAALLEWEFDPFLSEQHIRQALAMFSQYGGAWSACLAWRSQLQIRHCLCPSEDQTGALWRLESMYLKFRPEYFRDIGFEEFMERQEYLELF